ncbi:MAG: NAD(P)-binding domain-containing protein [Acidobacteria bacterium]|nr:NAD(P)-binding domain-containing protein [Acidobacteriota bacterium]MBV9071380.1 NAD(P)-binding domain-containing protein [Acidobacteriota bacterium]MBV9186430.1 NAD(P)-binding domain-containing protein [Acidobacteriota bacterium]
MKNVKVGILGSGDVGKSFARAFGALGHEVVIGSRSPEKLSDFVGGEGDRVTSGTFEEAARSGDLLVLATHGLATEEALTMAGKSNFDHKVVIDATNPLDQSGGMPRLVIGLTDSLGEQIQRSIPNARVVKAFNTVGNPLFFKPELPGGPPDMFIGGNDADAKKLVSQVCEAFGWGVIDLGGIEASRYLEPMCMAWVVHGVISGTWMHAFKMLHK